jgi:polar amino acid transport system substrate-binding protein
MGFGFAERVWLSVVGFVLFQLVVPPTFVHGDEILLVADEWCPYNCDPGGNAPGYIVEIAKLALEREGHRVTYKVVPWARAIEGTRNGIYDGIIGAGKDEVPDFIFPDNEVGQASHSFFVTKESTWKFTGLDALKNVKLGVIKNYSYGVLFNNYIQLNIDNPKRIFIIAGDDPLTRNIRMLLSSRVDVIVEDQNVMAYYFKSRGRNNPLMAAGVVGNEAIYIAFSPAKHKSTRYASALDNAMLQLKTSGVLKDLLFKYGIKEW